MPRGLVAMARSGGHCPLRVSGGILCSERGQSRDAFHAIRLEETSPRCNKSAWMNIIASTYRPKLASNCCIVEHFGSIVTKLCMNFLYV